MYITSFAKISLFFSIIFHSFQHKDFTYFWLNLFWVLDIFWCYCKWYKFLNSFFIFLWYIKHITDFSHADFCMYAVILLNSFINPSLILSFLSLTQSCTQSSANNDYFISSFLILMTLFWLITLAMASITILNNCGDDTIKK